MYIKVLINLYTVNILVFSLHGPSFFSFFFWCFIFNQIIIKNIFKVFYFLFYCLFFLINIFFSKKYCSNPINYYDTEDPYKT